MLTEIFPESVHVSQLFSTVLCNLVFGELIQAKRDMGNPDMLLTESILAEQTDVLPFDSTEYFNSYIAKTYYKTASMISLGCRGIGVLMNFEDIED